MVELFTAENLIALLTLTALEIVLGIDNIVFIAIISAKLPQHLRPRARRIGLAAAMIMRILLLLTLNWIMKLTAPLFAVFGYEFSGRDLILLVGGLFLLGKATYEIHDKLEVAGSKENKAAAYAGFASIIVQIMILDMVFSLDSVITAVGMADHISVMVTAVVISVGVMMAFANSISEFIEKHPTLKMLALSFLILIGVMLVLEGMGTHIEKGYIYFAMGFSLSVEMLNLRMRRKARSA